jgi:hypothetical protein
MASTSVKYIQKGNPKTLCGCKLKCERCRQNLEEETILDAFETRSCKYAPVTFITSLTLCLKFWKR